MRRYFFITISTLTLFWGLSAPSHARGERSPCVLTASERAMVHGLTYMRDVSSTDQIIRKCVVLETNTILIYYEDGNVEVFGLGEPLSLDRKQTEVQPEKIGEDDDPHNVPRKHLGNEQERKISAELERIWRNSPDDTQ